MARKFNGTSSDYLQSASNIDLTAFKTLSIAFWAWIDAYTNADHYFLQFYNGSALAGAFVLNPDWSFALSGQNWWLMDLFPSASGETDYFARPSAAAWHHFVIQMSMPGGTRPILGLAVDGNPTTFINNSQDQNQASFQSGLLTVMAARGPIGNCAGRMEQLALWGAAAGTTTPLLSNADITAVYRGTPQAASVQPTYYWPINGTQSPEPATVGNVALTVHGTTQVAGHAGTSGRLRRVAMSGGFSTFGEDIP